MSAGRKTKVPLHEAVAGVNSRWPADFASPHHTLLVGGCVLAWGVILAILATGNDLLGLKKALLIISGARMEPVLGLASLQSVDLAVVLFAFILVAGAGYVHVSAGLAVLLALRPWLDGFTYPTDNFYFLWVTLYLAALWAVRQLRNPQPVRGQVPLVLLGLYWMSGALSALSSIQFDATFRELLHWSGYGFMLFLAINATGSHAARGLLLLGFLAGIAGQAIFAYPHLWYILPWLRDYLQEDPRRLAQWFKGATEFTPELARRFNLNRAFASMVFPNALAALLILGLPVTFAAARNGLTVLRAKGGNDATPGPRDYRFLLPWAPLLFAGIAIPLYLLGQLPLSYGLGGPPWFGAPRNLALLSAGSAALVSAAFLLLARRRGLLIAARMLGAVSAIMLSPVMLGALWITYSRGAMLALIIACVAGAVIAGMKPGLFLRARHGAPQAGGRLLLLLAGSVALFAAVALAHAQDAGSPPSSVVTGEGMDISVRELVDPNSLRLRLSYWRVALTVALDHSGTGVGLGNFRIAYGPYQYLGAGDVQNAHNAVLQAWCEAGLPGALTLIAFWAYFLWMGASAIGRTNDTALRRLLLGLYCGVLAFLLHALLDINFSHPSLVLFVMAAAGLFYSYAGTDPRSTGPTTRLLALPMLVLSALFAGMALRPYLLDLSTNGGRFINVSHRGMTDSRHNAALYFLAECTAWARKGKPAPPPALPIADVVSLLPDRDTLFQVGRVLAPDPERRQLVPLATRSALPPDAVFQIVRPWDAHYHAFTQVETWLAELERLDARFPHDPQNAYLLANLYKLLIEQRTPRQADREADLLNRMLKWSEEAVRRSPMHKDMHQTLAWAHWCYGTNTTGAESLNHFQQALRSFERSRQLAPVEPSYYFAHAEALGAMGRSHQNAGKSAEGARYLAESARVKADGERIQRARWDLGLQ